MFWFGLTRSSSFTLLVNLLDLLGFISRISVQYLAHRVHLNDLALSVTSRGLSCSLGCSTHLIPLASQVVYLNCLAHLIYLLVHLVVALVKEILPPLLVHLVRLIHLVPSSALGYMARLLRLVFLISLVRLVHWVLRVYI